MVFDFLQFLANLLIAGVLLRFLEIKLADTEYGKALTFIY